MNVTRTAKFENGKLVYDPPYTPAELKADKQRFAEMCAIKQAPGAYGTDRAYMEGAVLNHGFERGDLMADHYIATAKRAGINIQGKVYRGGLGKPDDPLAWVGGRDDAIAAAKAKNLNLHQGSTLVHKAVEMPPTPDVPLAPKIIQRFAKRYVNEDPNWVRKPQELKEMIVAKHGASAKRPAKAWTPPPGWKDVGDS